MYREKVYFLISDGWILSLDLIELQTEDLGQIQLRL